MEIKTTEMITEENYEHLDAWFTFDKDSEMRKLAEKKWVSVENIIQFLNDWEKEPETCDYGKIRQFKELLQSSKGDSDE